MHKLHSRKNKFWGLVLTLCLCMMLPVSVRAEGTTTIHLSGNTVNVGENVTVTITASESGSVSVKYNPDILEFAGSSAEYSIDGNVVTFSGDKSAITFKAIGQGKSGIIVSSPTLTGSSASVSATASSTQSQANDQNQATAATEQNNQTNQTITTTVSNGQFEIDGIAYVVSERFAERMIPAGFKRTTITIDGYGYKELTNGNITLLYLKKADDIASDGTFYVYDQETNTVSPFEMIGSAEHYILLMSPTSFFRDGLEEVSVSIDDREVHLYAMGEAKEFYFGYGVDQNGIEGWYQYDSVYGTIQRVNEEQFANISSEPIVEEVPVVSDANQGLADKLKKQRYLVAVLIFVIVVLTILLLNLLLARSRRDEDEEDEDAEEGGDEEEIDEEKLVMESPELANIDTLKEENRIEHPKFDDMLENDFDTLDDGNLEVVDVSVEQSLKAVDASEEQSADVMDASVELSVDASERYEIEDELATDENEDVKLDLADLAWIREEVEHNALLEDEMEEATEEVVETKREVESKVEDAISRYSTIKGTEAFQSKKDTHYKADAGAQLDIIDLNDL